MESYIPIAYLNDFIFCPRSIYFHQLYGQYEQRQYKQTPQLKGTAAHQTIDTKTASTRSQLLQGLDVYSDQYNLCGKIDTYDCASGLLTERKRQITRIYDGYVFQLYAQCQALREMGYKVKKIRCYSLADNRIWPLDLPEDNPHMQRQFEQLIREINQFDMRVPFTANPAKCCHCIYNQLCDASAAE